jgi:ATP-binding cassette subfamily F protein uup
MNILSCTALAKSYHDVPLFTNISFGMESGERVGIIGRNGVGKSTLLNIIAGLDVPDSGESVINSSIRVVHVPQAVMPDDDSSVLQYVMQGRSDLVDALYEHHALCSEIEHSNDEKLHRRLHQLTDFLEHENAWLLERQALSIAHELGLEDTSQSMFSLSGGQRKRAALARALVAKPDLLILDEPTNHLDADTVQWLQDYLAQSSLGVIFITHDRYFLDAVATRIVEIDQQRCFTYAGNYEEYLMQKENFQAVQQATTDHEANKLRSELAWLAKGAKARRTKQKSRIDWVEKLSDDHAQREKKLAEKRIEIEVGANRLGSKILEAVSVKKSIGGKLLFDNFTYNASAGDRIGIIGPNGTGKTTLLNMLAGRIQPDTGTMKIGSTAKIGFYEQEIRDIALNHTVIGAVREIAEHIDTGIGRDRYLSARDMLLKFGFPPKQHHVFVSTLSGGELRRLALIRILIGNPNVLLFDEPTNDLDIATLTSLEEYLDDFYGCLIVVSHDRAFLDRAVQFIYAFEPGGIIKQYPGNYSAYLEKKELRKEADKEQNKESLKKDIQHTTIIPTASSSDSSEKKRRSYKEQKEIQQAERKVHELEQRKKDLEAFLAQPQTDDYQIIMQKSTELAECQSELEEIFERWLLLQEST